MKRTLLVVSLSACTALSSVALAQGRARAPLLPRETAPRATADSAWLCPAAPGDECADSTGLRWFAEEEGGTAADWWTAGFETVQTERRPVGLCRAPFGPEGGGLAAELLGTLSVYAECTVGVEGRAVAALMYEVLVGGGEGTPENDPLPRARWVAARAAAIPRTALHTGSLEGQSLAICRVRVRGDHRLGYAGPRTRGCVTTVSGRGTAVAVFEVLVAPARPRR